VKKTYEESSSTLAWGWDNDSKVEIILQDPPSSEREQAGFFPNQTCQLRSRRRLGSRLVSTFTNVADVLKQRLQLSYEVKAAIELCSAILFLIPR
jgi:hypothetical protein